MLLQFIKQFFPTRTVPKEVKVLTDAEIEETIKCQLEVGALLFFFPTMLPCKHTRRTAALASLKGSHGYAAKS